MERVRTLDLPVASYVSSYDVSNNPTVVEGEIIQSVKSKSLNFVIVTPSPPEVTPRNWDIHVPKSPIVVVLPKKSGVIIDHVEKIDTIEDKTILVRHCVTVDHYLEQNHPKLPPPGE